jgi:hypothetical protein
VSEPNNLTLNNFQISGLQLELDEMTKKALKSQLKVEDLNKEILLLQDDMMKIQSSALIESKAYELKIRELQICITNCGSESEKHNIEMKREKTEYETLDFVTDTKIVKLTMENQILVNNSEDMTKKLIEAKHKTVALEAEVFLLQEHINSLKIATLSEIQKKIAELEMSQRVSHDIHIQKLRTEIQENDIIYEKTTDDLQIQKGQFEGFQIELDQMIAKLFASKNKTDNLTTDKNFQEKVESPRSVVLEGSPVIPLEVSESSSDRRSLTIDTTKKPRSRSRLPCRKQSTNVTAHESQRPPWSESPIDQPSQLLKTANQSLRTGPSRKPISQVKK